MFTLILLVASLICLNEAVVSVKSSKYDWDFLLYVERWPGTITQQPLHKNITTFVLHGMWAERNDNTWPQYCPGSSFDEYKLNPIIDELEEYWPDLQFHSGSDYLWKHEWEKHGTCAADGTMASITDQYSFFSQALKFHTYLPIEDVLAKSNIYPSTSKQYYQNDIESALSKGFNNTMFISCDRRSGNLMRVYSCIGKYGNLIDCPAAVARNLQSRSDCDSGSSIGFPPINHQQ